jgi:hypothetical protein
VFPFVGAFAALAFYEFVFKKARELCNQPEEEESGSGSDDLNKPENVYE